MLRHPQALPLLPSYGCSEPSAIRTGTEGVSRCWPKPLLLGKPRRVSTGSPGVHKGVSSQPALSCLGEAPWQARTGRPLWVGVAPARQLSLGTFHQGLSPRSVEGFFWWLPFNHVDGQVCFCLRAVAAKGQLHFRDSLQRRPSPSGNFKTKEKGAQEGSKVSSQGPQWQHRPETAARPTCLHRAQAAPSPECPLLASPKPAQGATGFPPAQPEPHCG